MDLNAWFYQVKIQYRGEGEIVEVTGSFNGWDPDHRIRMDPLSSSGITDSIGSRSLIYILILNPRFKKNILGA